jgi:uncharacterized membrane protein YgdD (TMEM256/DUF423 family)
MTLMARLHAAFAVIGGLFGAAGVALLAAGAHGADAARLTTAGGFLLAHAPALLALAVWPPAADRGTASSLAGLGLALGPALFAGDLVMRVFFGNALFAMAAPTGGLLTIAAWLAAAAMGLQSATRR